MQYEVTTGGTLVPGFRSRLPVRGYIMSVRFYFISAAEVSDKSPVAGPALMLSIADSLEDLSPFPGQEIGDDDDEACQMLYLDL